MRCGSNGSRLRLWKCELQRLAVQLGIDIVVHHLPPGTSKWNKIEHRLFSFITMNWKAQPLVSYRVIVDLIGATKTRTGLAVRCELDSTEYPKGIVVSDHELHNLHIHQMHFRDVTAADAIDGRAPLLDTVNIPPAIRGPSAIKADTDIATTPGVVRLRLKFTRAMIGEFVFHCHLLFHEDGGMMKKIRVVAD